MNYVLAPCGYCGKPLRETDLPGVCRSCDSIPVCYRCGEQGANVKMGTETICLDCVPDDVLHSRGAA